jgi:hypothetical protein
VDADHHEDQHCEDAQPDQERHDGQDHDDRVLGAGRQWR